MSKLTVALNRVRTLLRACEHSVRIVPNGQPILQIGLGDGRLYGHLHTLFPTSPVIALDVRCKPYGHPTPNSDHLVLGSIERIAEHLDCHFSSKAGLVVVDSLDPNNEIAASFQRSFSASAVNSVSARGVLLTAASGQNLSTPSLSLPHLVTYGDYALFAGAPSEETRVPFRNRSRTPLDRFFSRLSAQYSCLTLAHELLRDVPGPIIEMGLANGRTYDHLVSLFPDRDIFVFDINPPHADNQLRLPPDRLILGDVRHTLPDSTTLIGGLAALAHFDIGSGKDDIDTALAAEIAPPLRSLMANGAVVSSLFEMPLQSSRPLFLPDQNLLGKYWMYRCHSELRP